MMYYSKSFRNVRHRFIGPVAACVAMTILVEFNFVENNNRCFISGVFPLRSPFLVKKGIMLDF